MGLIAASALALPGCKSESSAAPTPGTNEVRTPNPSTRKTPSFSVQIGGRDWKTLSVENLATLPQRVAPSGYHAAYSLPPVLAAMGVTRFKRIDVVGKDGVRRQIDDSRVVAQDVLLVLDRAGRFSVVPGMAPKAWSSKVVAIDVIGSPVRMPGDNRMGAGVPVATVGETELDLTSDFLESLPGVLVLRGGKQKRATPLSEVVKAASMPVGGKVRILVEERSFILAANSPVLRERLFLHLNRRGMSQLLLDGALRKHLRTLEDGAELTVDSLPAPIPLAQEELARQKAQCADVEQEHKGEGMGQGGGNGSGTGGGRGRHRGAGNCNQNLPIVEFQMERLRNLSAIKAIQ